MKSGQGLLIQDSIIHKRIAEISLKQFSGSFQASF